jgi:hypothetical protein
VTRLLHMIDPRPNEAAMTPTPGLAALTLAGTLAYLGAAILGAGGLAAFFPIRPGLPPQGARSGISQLLGFAQAITAPHGSFSRKRRPSQ